MTKEYRKYLKENDPIHYSELMGDPVTGLKTDNTNNTWLVVLITLIFIGVIISIIIIK